MDADGKDEEEDTRKKGNAASTAVKWQAEEINELKTFFADCLKTGVTPGKKLCMKAIAVSKQEKGMLCRRSWETIKKKVWNIFKKEYR